MSKEEAMKNYVEEFVEVCYVCNSTLENKLANFFFLPINV